MTLLEFFCGGGMARAGPFEQGHTVGPYATKLAIEIGRHHLERGCGCGYFAAQSRPIGSRASPYRPRCGAAVR